VHLLVSELRAF